MRLTNIQAARFLCALAVLLSHLSLLSRTMFLTESPVLRWIEDHLTGPALFTFFAISGFVLMHSMPVTPPRQFLLARLLRIFPPYWCVAGGYLVVVLLLNKFIPASFGQLSAGLLLAPVGREATYHPLGVEWSLVFEVAFYTVLGLSVLVVPVRYVRVIVGVWLFAVLVGLSSEPGPYQAYPRWGQLLLSPITLPFLGGALAAPLTRRPDALRAIAPIAVPALLVVTTQFRRWDLAILCSAVACTILVAWLAVGRQLRPGNPLVRFGDCSYGIYLVHMPVMYTIFTLILKTRFVTPEYYVVVCTGLFALAFGLTYGYCEAATYRKLKRRMFHRTAVSAPAVPLRTAA